jgi:hypothetical protein
MGIEPGTSGSVTRNSDHQTTEQTLRNFLQSPVTSCHPGVSTGGGEDPLPLLDLSKRVKFEDAEVVYPILIIIIIISWKN